LQVNVNLQNKQTNNDNNNDDKYVLHKSPCGNSFSAFNTSYQEPTALALLMGRAGRLTSSIGVGVKQELTDKSHVNIGRT
jgi:hypothetical protein